MAGKKNSFSQFDADTRKRVPEYSAQDSAPRAASGSSADVQDVGHEVRDHSSEWGVPEFKRSESKSYDAAKEAEKYVR